MRRKIPLTLASLGFAVLGSGNAGAFENDWRDAAVPAPTTRTIVTRAGSSAGTIDTITTGGAGAAIATRTTGGAAG